MAAAKYGNRVGGGGDLVNLSSVAGAHRAAGQRGLLKSRRAGA
jgi:hypothetical protein